MRSRTRTMRGMMRPHGHDRRAFAKAVAEKENLLFFFFFRILVGSNPPSVQELINDKLK